MDVRKFVGTSFEDVATELSNMIRQEYTNHLEFLRDNAITDREEPKYWEKRLLAEPSIVSTRVYDKIMRVMQDPDQYRELLKKRFPGSKPVIRITRVSSFFEGIFPGPQNAIPKNVEWLINVRKLSLEKRVYSKYTNCN